MGGLTCGSVEFLEMGFPLLVEQMEVETDAMGFGRWNGGPGVRSKISPVNGDMETMGVGEGINNPPHGVAGGKRSTGGGIWVQHADGSRTYTSSAHQLLISVGESWNGVSLGGGGWGNPIDRPPEQVRRDILNEFVSEKTAREVFGVVLNDDLERTLDLSATELLRKELAAVERPFIDQANESEASEWTRSRMTERDRYLEQPTLQSQLAKK
jgi:N-methylhydantoinase B